MIACPNVRPESYAVQLKTSSRLTPGAHLDGKLLTNLMYSSVSVLKGNLSVDLAYIRTLETKASHVDLSPVNPSFGYQAYNATLCAQALRVTLPVTRIMNYGWFMLSVSYI